MDEPRSWPVDTGFEAGVLVRAAGVRQGGQDEVEVLAVDAGDDVGEVDAPGADGVGEGCDDGEDSSFASGQPAEAGRVVTGRFRSLRGAMRT